MDQNIEKVVLTGNSADFKYQQAGNTIKIFSSSNELITSAPLQGDSDGTQLTFSNGTANAILSSGVMSLGGAAVSSASATAVTPVSFAVAGSSTTDTTSPIFNASGSTPIDNATNVSLTNNITLKFSEAISSTLSNTSHIYLKSASNNADVASTITVSNDTIIIDPTSSLSGSSGYYVTWDADAIKDTAGNAAAAVNDTTTFNFTTPVATSALPDLAIKLVSTSSTGVIGNGYSFSPSVSADGRYVSFDSLAINLVSGDTNDYLNSVYIKDTQTGEVKLVSANSAGVIVNSKTYNRSISDDGRYVAFVTENSSIYIKDTQTEELQLLSVGSTGIIGENPTFSSDGRYIAFESTASNIVSGDTNGQSDVFIKDTQTGIIQLVSKSSAGAVGNSGSYNPSISVDGKYITFSSDASNLVNGDTNMDKDIFIKDTQTGEIKLLSESSARVIGNYDSSKPSISSDGKYVAFTSGAGNLLIEDSPYHDIFIKDTQTGAIKLVSASSAGVGGNYDSYSPSISADGRYVAFESKASNLVSGDTTQTSDIFIKDTQTGAIQLASVSSGGAIGNGQSYAPSISTDGKYITFYSYASNLVSGDTNDSPDIFIVGNALYTAPLI